MTSENRVRRDGTADPREANEGAGFEERLAQLTQSVELQFGAVVCLVDDGVGEGVNDRLVAETEDDGAGNGDPAIVFDVVAVLGEGVLNDMEIDRRSAHGAVSCALCILVFGMTRSRYLRYSMVPR